MISRFIDVIAVANYILRDYECTMRPLNFENLTPKQIDRYFACKQPGLDNVLELARRTVIDIAELRAVGKAMRERRQHRSQQDRKDDDVQFEL